jgi:hypothetical protein
MAHGREGDKRLGKLKPGHQHSEADDDGKRRDKERSGVANQPSQLEALRDVPQAGVTRQAELLLEGATPFAREGPATLTDEHCRLTGVDGAVSSNDRSSVQASGHSSLVTRVERDKTRR